MSQVMVQVKILGRVKAGSDLHLKRKNALRNELYGKRSTTVQIKNNQSKARAFVEMIGVQIKPQHLQLNQLARGRTDLSILSPRTPHQKLQKIKGSLVKTEIVGREAFKPKKQIQHQRMQTQINPNSSEIASPALRKNITTQSSSPTKKNKIRLKTLPRIDLQAVQQSKYSEKIDRPLLSSFELELRKIKSQHYFIMEQQSKQVIIAYRSKTKIQVASLTKILTFLTVYRIALEKGINLKSERFVIPEEVVDFPGTTAYLQEGQVYTIEQLLYGLMLPSGNDAALSLAIWGGMQLADNNSQVGAEKMFMKRMNKEAKQLGMSDSFFGNPHGLPHRQSQTTCEDMALLCSQCLQIPLFLEVVSTKVYKYKIYDQIRKNKFTHHWQNTNKLLRRPGFLGIKTGITVTAGPCLASAYQFRDKIYIVILAKCNKLSRRFKQTRYLLAHCLRKIPHQEPLTGNEELILRRLNRANDDLDSDYSDEEKQFNFSSFSPEEVEKRKRIITQH